MNERVELRKKLIVLPQPQFEDILIRLKVPSGNIPPPQAPPANRVDALLAWSSAFDPNFNKLKRAYSEVCAEACGKSKKDWRRGIIGFIIFLTIIFLVYLLLKSSPPIKIGRKNPGARESNKVGLIKESWYSWENIKPDNFPFSRDKHIFSSWEHSEEFYICISQESLSTYKIGKTFLGNCNIASYSEPIPDEDLPGENYFRPSKDRREVLVPFENSQILTIDSQLVEYEWISVDIDFLSNGRLLDQLSDYYYRFSKDGREFIICKAFYGNSWHPGILDGKEGRYFCAFPYDGRVGWLPNRDTSDKAWPYDESDKRRVEFLVVRLLDNK